MNDTAPAQSPPFDLGDYCRRVEDYLTRANAGHLVRIVGSGFELVRGWADAGVPLSVVFRGIDMKVERHKDGQARRPLRIEFCEADVRAVFESWRRAVGLTTGIARAGAESAADSGTDAASDTAVESKRPSLSRQLDRAIDRLSRVGGRLDWPSDLRDVCDRVLRDLVEIRTAAAKVRGAAREEFVARIPALDAALADAVRTHAPESLRTAMARDAAGELAPYRSRLSPDAWQRSVDVTADRLLRDKLGLPLLDL